MSYLMDSLSLWQLWSFGALFYLFGLLAGWLVLAQLALSSSARGLWQVLLGTVAATSGGALVSGLLWLSAISHG